MSKHIFSKDILGKYPLTHDDAKEKPSLHLHLHTRFLCTVHVILNKITNANNLTCHTMCSGD